MSNDKNIHPFKFCEHLNQSMNQMPLVIWLTGISASGKSTIANFVDLLLRSTDKHTTILDGDTLRNGLCRDLGFSMDDRNENIRRIAETACLMVDAGLIVIVAAISPTRACRHHARSIIGHARFIEVFVDTPLAVAEARDPKGLYVKARQGSIKGFTGVTSDYEAPIFPEVHLCTVDLSPSLAAQKIVDWITDPSRCH